MRNEQQTRHPEDGVPEPLLQGDYGNQPGIIRLDGNAAAPPTPFRLDPDTTSSRQAQAGNVAERYRALALGLIVSDVVCLLAALAVSYLVHFGTGGMRGAYMATIVAAPALWIAVFGALSLYSPQHLSASEEFRRIISASSIGMLLIVVAIYSSHTQLSRTWLALTWALALLLELTSRRLWRWVVWRLKVTHWLSFRTLIVGANAEGRAIADALSLPGTGYDVFGLIETSRQPVRAARLGIDERVTATLKDLDDLEATIADNGIECLFMASTAIDPADTVRVVQVARRRSIKLMASANLPEILTSRLSAQHLAGVMALSLRPVRITGLQSLFKRAFDLIASVSALILLSPVIAVIALLVKVTSPGSVLFRSERVTSGGRPFIMFKFRTMVDNAAEMMRERAADTSVPFFKHDTDSCLTPVGGMLRRLSLDELPQLVNVVRGEMSLVGPRPLPAEQVAANLSLLTPRHEVRAGMTGWWQIQGRSDLLVDEALRMDLFYIENWSLSLDLYILLKTLGAVIRRRGAY